MRPNIGLGRFASKIDSNLNLKFELLIIELIFALKFIVEHTFDSSIEFECLRYYALFFEAESWYLGLGLFAFKSIRSY